MRKTRPSRGRDAKFYVINVTLNAEDAAWFHIREELIAKERQHFRTFLDDDFPESLQPEDSPHESRQCGHPIETNAPIEHRLNILPPAERVEFNR
jgi:hypothetical protein